MNTFAKSIAAALALCFAAAATPAAAEDNLPTRAVTALGIAIATQGDRALIEIREELRRDLLESLKPLLPQPEPTHDTPDAQH